jgi:hypothetical protein
MATHLERRMGPVPDAQSTNSRWRTLYRLGGAAALISAVLIPIQVMVFIAWPPPTTVSGWFRLFQSNPLAALIDLDLLLVVDNVLLVVVLLALYVLLRQTSEAVMAIATALGLLGIALFVTSNPAFEMLSLSDQYAGAATDAQRSTFLAAGEAMLATWQGTAFQAAYLLGSVAGIAIGAVMLRSGIFGRLTASMAILGNAVGLGLYVPKIGVYIAVFSVVFLEVWYVLVTRRLLRLGRGLSKLEVDR